MTLVCTPAPAERERPAVVEALANRLRGRRVAAVCTSDTEAAVRAGDAVAAALGVAVTVCWSLRGASDGPGAAPEPDVLERHREQFETIADLHRGETVLVVGDRAALAVVVPALVRNVTPAWAEDHALGEADTVEVEGDADGWVLRRWGCHLLEQPD